MGVGLIRLTLGDTPNRLNSSQAMCQALYIKTHYRKTVRNKFYDDTHCPYAHLTLAQLALLTISIPLTVTHRILSGAG